MFNRQRSQKGWNAVFYVFLTLWDTEEILQNIVVTSTCQKISNHSKPHDWSWQMDPSKAEIKRGGLPVQQPKPLEADRPVQSSSRWSEGGKTWCCPQAQMWWPRCIDMENVWSGKSITSCPERPCKCLWNGSPYYIYIQRELPQDIRRTHTPRKRNTKLCWNGLKTARSEFAQIVLTSTPTCSLEQRRDILQEMLELSQLITHVSDFSDVPGNIHGTMAFHDPLKTLKTSLNSGFNMGEHNQTPSQFWMNVRPVGTRWCWC